jgi:hypothetical protein
VTPGLRVEESDVEAILSPARATPRVPGEEMPAYRKRAHELVHERVHPLAEREVDQKDVDEVRNPLGRADRLVSADRDAVVGVKAHDALGLAELGARHLHVDRQLKSVALDCEVAVLTLLVVIDDGEAEGLESCEVLLSEDALGDGPDHEVLESFDSAARRFR